MKRSSGGAERAKPAEEALAVGHVHTDQCNHSTLDAEDGVGVGQRLRTAAFIARAARRQAQNVPGPRAEACLARRECVGRWTGGASGRSAGRGPRAHRPVQSPQIRRRGGCGSSRSTRTADGSGASRTKCPRLAGRSVLGLAGVRGEVDKEERQRQQRHAAETNSEKAMEARGRERARGEHAGRWTTRSGSGRRGTWRGRTARRTARRTGWRPAGGSVRER